MNELRIIESKLVQVDETDKGEKVVYGSELHEILGVSTPYRIWIERRLSECDALSGEDYEAEQICSPSGQMMKEHLIRLDTAKEMAMLERNEKGKQVRRYFIAVEKKFKETAAGRFSSSVDIDFEMIDKTAESLGFNRNEKIQMIKKYLESKGVTTCFLPESSDFIKPDWNRASASAAALLTKNGLGMPYNRFIKALVSTGYLEVRKAPCSYKPGKLTEYKAFTEKGSPYGFDQKSEGNKNSTVPRFYEDSFMELYEAVIR